MTPPDTETTRTDLERLLGAQASGAVAQARSGVLITDAAIDPPGPRIVYANPAFSAITGYELSEVLGYSPRLLQGPRTERPVLDQLRYCLKQEQAFLGRTWNYRKDGMAFLMEWSIAPLRLDQGLSLDTGDVTHFIAIQRDVTTGQALADEVLTSRELLEQTARVARIGGWTFEPESGYMRLTSSARQLLELPESATPSLETLLDLCPKAEDRQWLGNALTAAAEHEQTWDMAIEIQTPGNRQRWLRVAGESTLEAGRVTRVSGIVQDVTDQQVEVQRRQDAEDRVAQIGHQIPGFFYQLRSRQDHGVNEVTYVSSGITRHFGLSATEAVANPRGWLDRVHPEDKSTIVDREAPGPGRTGDWRARYRLRARHPDSGLEHDEWVEDTATWRETEPGWFVWHGIVMPIGQRQAMEDELRRQTYYDSLTGLPNRRLKLIRLAEAIEHARETNSCLAVLYIDIDDFRDINDAWGRSRGDSVIKAVAESISAQVPDINDLARIGGDELVIIDRRAADEEAAGELAEKVLAEFQEPMTVDDQAFPIELSIGISLYPEDGADANTLVSHANAALHAVRQAGGRTWGFYRPELAASAIDRVKTKTHMQSALDNQEFAVAYQPIVRTPDHAIVGHEALARWPQPNNEPVSPGKFIPLAESYGLITELGAYIFDRACRWRGFGPGPPAAFISVNVSPRQLDSDEFVDMVEARINDANIEPGQVLLELTEEVLMRANPAPLERLYRLREQGIRIAIDDFGTGYASLTYLANLPADVLKIDQAFVQDLDRNDKQVAIVKTVVSLARSFDLQVLAEGVETEAEAKAAADLGCDLLQGFYLGKPKIPTS